jgi:excisionase family DNA binding protein
MNIKEAAGYLGISIKTLERKIAGGEVSVAYVPGATGKQRTFDPAELDRFKEAEAAKTVATSYVARARVATVASNGDKPQQQALERATGEQGMALFVSMLTDALAATRDGKADVPLRDKMTLSFKEAAQLSGVPEDHLRMAHKSGELRGAKIGRGVRVTPDDVRKYVEQRMKAKK